jgi:hypothetical protein
METRRDFLLHSAAALGLGAVSRAGEADTEPRDVLPDGRAAKGMITKETQDAIDAGLLWLSGQQQQNGMFGSGQYVGNVAVTSLAALAMMAAGHQPGRGRYGQVVTRALQYVLSCEQNMPMGGYLMRRAGGNSHGPMYGHGFGTLFLAEVQGMVHDRELRAQLRDTLERCVRLIENSQNPEGGWRYTPVRRDADLSVTICQVMALRAARNAGLHVKKAVIDRCTAYVKRCQDDRDGGFKYMAQAGGGTSAFARSAAGVVALYCAGIYKGPELDAGLRYLMRHKPSRQYFHPNIQASIHYYYGHYYAVQAMWTAGGDWWNEWYPAIRDELLSHPDRQRGAWLDHRICHEYATAMACIILQVPNNYLPILQK